MARFTAYVRTDNVGSEIERTFEVPDDELSDCGTDTERDEVIASYAQDAIAND